VIRFLLCLIFFWKKAFDTRWIRGCVGQSAYLDVMAKRNIPAFSQELNHSLELVARHLIDRAILAHPKVLCSFVCNIIFSCYRYLFYMDVKDIRNSLKICVKQCPDRNLTNFTHIQEFYERTKSLLCM